MEDDFDKKFKEKCFKEEKEDKKKKDKDCKGCICNIIKKFKNDQVIIRTKSGDVIEGEIVDFDKKTCCVKILQAEMMSPMMPAILTIISCEDIESISIELLDGDTSSSSSD